MLRGWWLDLSGRAERKVPLGNFILARGVSESCTGRRRLWLWFEWKSKVLREYILFEAWFIYTNNEVSTFCYKKENFIAMGLLFLPLKTSRIFFCSLLWSTPIKSFSRAQKEWSSKNAFRSFADRISPFRVNENSIVQLSDSEGNWRSILVADWRHGSGD